MGASRHFPITVAEVSLSRVAWSPCSYWGVHLINNGSSSLNIVVVVTLVLEVCRRAQSITPFVIILKACRGTSSIVSSVSSKDADIYCRCRRYRLRKPILEQLCSRHYRPETVLSETADSFVTIVEERFQMLLTPSLLPMWIGCWTPQTPFLSFWKCVIGRCSVPRYRREVVSSDTVVFVVIVVELCHATLYFPLLP